MKSLCRLCLSVVLLWGNVPFVGAQDEGEDSGGDAGSSDSGSSDTGGSTGGQTAPAGEDDGGDENAKAGDDFGPAGRLGGSLGGSIRAMIQLLEAKRYQEMLENFLDPEEKAAILQNSTMPEFAARFGASGKPEDLLKILRSLRSKVPQFTSDGNFVSFVLDTSTDGVRDQIRFHKVEKRWCLKNR